MTARFQTGRGAYSLKILRQAEPALNGVVMTFGLESDNGLERIAFEYWIALEAVDRLDGMEVAVRITPWVASEFERLREAALRSIRTERTLLRVSGSGEFGGTF